jgi:AcrR family transcriptional regulator
MKTLSRRDPAARRARVLASATKQFAERGYELTNVNQVAADAGVSVGALYKYFPDKAALLEGVLDSFETTVVRSMAQVYDASGNYAERLQVMVDGLFSLAATEPYFFWALSSGSRGQTAKPPGSEVKREIARFIDAGIAAGDFRAVDSLRIASLGFGVVETAMLHCFGPEERGAFQREWAAATLHLLRAAVLAGD